MTDTTWTSTLLTTLVGELSPAARRAVLEHLEANSSDWDYYAQVALGCHTPLELFRFMATSPNPTVRLKAAHYPDMPHELLETLATDPDRTVGAAARRNLADISATIELTQMNDTADLAALQHSALWNHNRMQAPHVRAAVTRLLTTPGWSTREWISPVELRDELATIIAAVGDPDLLERTEDLTDTDRELIKAVQIEGWLNDRSSAAMEHALPIITRHATDPGTALSTHTIKQVIDTHNPHPRRKFKGYNNAHSSTLDALVALSPNATSGQLVELAAYLQPGSDNDRHPWSWLIALNPNANKHTAARYAQHELDVARRDIDVTTMTLPHPHLSRQQDAISRIWHMSRARTELAPLYDQLRDQMRQLPHAEHLDLPDLHPADPGQHLIDQLRHDQSRFLTTDPQAVVDASYHLEAGSAAWRRWQLLANKLLQPADLDNVATHALVMLAVTAAHDPQASLGLHARTLIADHLDQRILTHPMLLNALPHIITSPAPLGPTLEAVDYAYTEQRTIRRSAARTIDTPAHSH